MAHVNASGDVRIAVDIGGTFTDIVLMKPDGVLSESKVSTTPDDPSRAVIAGVLELLRDHGVPPGARRRGPARHDGRLQYDSAAARRQDRFLITTRGFRDVLEIGRIRTPEMFDLTWKSRRRWFRAATASRSTSASRPTAASYGR